MGDRMLVGSVGVGGRVALWSLRGEELWSISATSWGMGPGFDGGTSLFYGTESGDLFERRLDTTIPDRLIAHLDPPNIPGRTLSPFAGVFSVDGSVLALTFRMKNGSPAPGVVAIDRTGVHPIELGVPGLVVLARRAIDKAWWLVVDGTKLFRSVGDQPAQQIEVAEEIRAVRPFGDEMWVFGRTRLYRFDARTVQQRSTAQLFDSNWSVINEGVITGTPFGVDVARPRLNTRRTLSLPKSPSQVRSNDSGTIVVAQLKLPDKPTNIVVWRDPVPTDPAQVPAFLEKLTNARLLMSSDAVTWDPQ
jgi:hypothetical protein